MQKSYNLNEVFIDVINNHNLEQIVNSPTTQNHMLDLILTSTPSLFKEPPGMSDHKAVIFSINCERPSINRKAPRKVYLYHKGDIPSLKDKLKNFKSTFVLWTYHRTQ